MQRDNSNPIGIGGKHLESIGGVGYLWEPVEVLRAPKCAAVHLEGCAGDVRRGL